MTRRFRRQFRLMQASAAVSVCVLAVVAAAAWAQAPTPQKFGEITVERINVVDANGTLRLVMSNKDRMHPGVIDGRTINRARPVAGLLFFNDQGDEVGGLSVSGQATDTQRRANAILAFDQLKQDQTIALTYSENSGERSTGLQIWDRPESSLGDLVDQINKANALEDRAQRDAALKEIRAKAPPAPRRIFVGKQTDRAATVSLADGAGRTRLTLKVEADGAASIEFLDAAGKVVQRLPAPQ
jgi:hypothetical protein